MGQTRVQAFGRPHRRGAARHAGWQGRWWLPLCCMTLAAPVQAQPAADDVVVSASRTEQRSFDAPAAIQSIDAQAIREAGPQINLSESLNRVPGVSVLNRQNYAQDLQLSIRGFGARSTFGIRGVRLLVDGIPATMPDGQGQASTISLASVSRIEVLRGPVAQLYGNAAGGVVQAFTRDAPAVPEAGAQAWLGSFDTRRLDLQAAGRSGSVGLVADYSLLSTEGYRDHSAALRRQFNGKLTVDRGDTRFTIVANSFSQPRALDPLGLTRAQFLADPRQAVPIAFTQNTRKTVDQNQVSVVAEHRLAGGDRVVLRAYGGQRDVDQALALVANGFVDLARDYGGVAAQYAGERRVAGTRLTFAAGVDYDRMNERRQAFANVAGNRGTLGRNEDNSVDNLDAYAQASWTFLPQWTLLGGVRTSRVQFRSRDRFLADGNGSGQVDYSATNPVVGLTWHASERLNVYANWGRGFEVPTFVELAYRPGVAANTVVDGLNFGLRAARSRHAELGVKWLATDTQRLDAALFSIETDGELVPYSTSGRATFQNAGRVRRQGAELAWRGRLADTVTALVSLSTLDATFRDGFARVDRTGVVRAGNVLPGAPNRQAFAEIVWRPGATDALAQPLAARTRGTHAAVELVHVGRLLANDLNTQQASAYTLVNLRGAIEQRAGPWRFTQYARLDNLADRRFAGSVIVNEANGRFFEPGPGRAWLVGVSATRAF